jgi:hypothetical protein
VQVRKIGFRDTVFLVSLSAKDTLPISLLLERITVLETVNVSEKVSGTSAGMRIFDAHRRVPLGKYLTPSEMRQVEDGTAIKDLLAARGWKEACAVYLNGLRVRSIPREYAFARDIEALEFYQSGLMAPAGYDSGSGRCPVLVLWTREK